MIRGQHLQAHPRNAVAMHDWDPVTLPTLGILHMLAHVASQMPTAYQDVTLCNLMHLATQETNTYNWQADDNGKLDDWTQLIHTISIQELWREWSSARTALS